MEPREATGVLALVVTMVLVALDQVAIAVVVVGTVGIWAFAGKPVSATSQDGRNPGKRGSRMNTSGVSATASIIVSAALLAPVVLGFAAGESGNSSTEVMSSYCGDCQVPKVNLKRNTFDVRRTLYNVPDCEDFGWQGEPYYDLENGTSWRDYEWNAYGLVWEATEFSSWDEALNHTDHIYVKFKGKDYRAEVTFELAELVNASAVIHLELWVEVIPGVWDLVIAIKDGEVVKESGTVTIGPESEVPLDITLAAKNIPTSDGSELAEPTQIVFAWEESYSIIH